ncbi:type III effector protein, partial [Actinoplanes digitatis]
MGIPEHGEAQAALTLILAATSGRPTAPTRPEPAATSRQVALTALIALRHLRDRLDVCEPQLIAAARAAGASWAELAPAMGVTSRQAAERRYLRIRRSEQDDATTTADQRVTAERDRRAGARAVTGWARANGADLRQLAGQITALTDLGPDAQASLDRLHHALGGSDPATLLPLLSDTHAYLQGRHAPLAERVTSVTDDADQVRRVTQRG